MIKGTAVGVVSPDEGHADLSTVSLEALIACEEGEEKGQDAIEEGNHDRQHQPCQVNPPTVSTLWRGRGGKEGGREGYRLP